MPLSHPIVCISHVPTFILATLPTGRTLFIFSGTIPHWWTYHWLHWITLGLLHIRVSLVVEIVKALPAVQETPVWSLGWEDALEKGMTTHSSLLAWRIPWTEEPGGLQSMELPMVGCDWVTGTHFATSLLQTQAIFSVPLCRQASQNLFPLTYLFSNPSFRFFSVFLDACSGK